MKLTAIILLLACLTVSARSNSQKVTFSGKDVSLEQVFSVVKKQTGYVFFYNYSLLQNARKVTLDVKDAPLQEVLALCFKDQPLDYVIENKTIIITERVKPRVPDQVGSPVVIENAGVEITGKVVTKEGEVLVSASVVVKRTRKGTQTDLNGNFKLKDVEPDDILLISYTGYTPQSIKVGDKKTFFVALEIAVDELNRVVVQGYGNTTRRFATGNIAKVTAEEIEKQPVINPLLALQGRVAGMVVTQNNGYVSAPIKVTIRGTNTIPLQGYVPATTDPLYIVDGVPLTVINSPLDDVSKGSSVLIGATTAAEGQSLFYGIDPASIESIEVLKDADATAIYGSRAANGVILITTKKGKAGRMSVSASVNQGISKIAGKRWKMLNTEEYLRIRREAILNDNIVPTINNAPDLLGWDQNRYTDWQSYLFDNKTGHNSNAQVSLSGGNQYTKVYFGTGYTRSADVLTISGVNQRGSFQLGLTQQFSSRLQATLSVNSSFAKNDLISLNGQTTLPPNAPSVFDSANNLNWAGWAPVQGNYPFANLLRPQTVKTNNLISNLRVGYQMVTGLEISTSLGYSNIQVDLMQLNPDFSQNPQYDRISTASFSYNNIKNWIVEPQINYNKRFGKVSMNVLFGASLQKNVSHGFSVNASDFPNNALLKSLRAAGKIFIGNDDLTIYKYAAIFGRFNINWSGKYILNLNARRDGSSRFGEANRFGNFASVAAAWIFSDEVLFKNNFKLLSFGKIRCSYGTTGSDGVGDYAYLSQWNQYGAYPYDNSPVLSPQNLVNPDYHWQVNKKLEVAIDLGFWKNKVLTSFAWYRNRCDNQLTFSPVAYTTGIPNVVNNSPASIQNSGWEFLVSAKIIDGKKIGWTINFNTGKNRNKLVAFPKLENSVYATKYIIGQPINLVRIFHYLGVDPQTGYYVVEDKNKDGIISRNNDVNGDWYLTTTDPKFSGGIGTDFSWKGLQLSVFFNVIVQKGFDAFSRVGLTAGKMVNLPVDILGNYWQKPGDNKKYAKLTTTSSSNSYLNFFSSDRVFADASFVRLQNLSISYKFPNKISKVIGLQNCSVYFIGNNLFVLTKYNGVDPESQNFGSMPPLKTFAGGIRIIL